MQAGTAVSCRHNVAPGLLSWLDSLAETVSPFPALASSTTERRALFAASGLRSADSPDKAPPNDADGAATAPWFTSRSFRSTKMSEGSAMSCHPQQSSKTKTQQHTNMEWGLIDTLQRQEFCGDWFLTSLCVVRERLALWIFKSGALMAILSFNRGMTRASDWLQHLTGEVESSRHSNHYGKTTISGLYDRSRSQLPTSCLLTYNCGQHQNMYLQLDVLRHELDALRHGRFGGLSRTSEEGLYEAYFDRRML